MLFLYETIQYCPSPQTYVALCVCVLQHMWPHFGNCFEGRRILLYFLLTSFLWKVLFFLTDPSRRLRSLSESLFSPGFRFFPLFSNLASILATASLFSWNAPSWKREDEARGLLTEALVYSPFLPPASLPQLRLVLPGQPWQKLFYDVLHLECWGQRFILYGVLHIELKVELEIDAWNCTTKTQLSLYSSTSEYAIKESWSSSHLYSQASSLTMIIYR